MSEVKSLISFPSDSPSVPTTLYPIQMDDVPMKDEASPILQPHSQVGSDAGGLVVNKTDQSLPGHYPFPPPTSSSHSHSSHGPHVSRTTTEWHPPSSSPSSSCLSTSLNDLKQSILKALPKNQLELHDPELLIEIPHEIISYAKALFGIEPLTVSSSHYLRHLTPGLAMYLYALCKYQVSHKLKHYQHFPCLQILLRYQNLGFGFQSGYQPKKFDPSHFFIHEKPLFDALAMHFRDPTDFIAFFRNFPALYLGHYLLRTMVSFTRHFRDVCNQGHAPPSLIILWDGDNLAMPESFLFLLNKKWIQLHVHVLVQGQQEWAFIKKLPNAHLHICHRTSKEAVDYRILEQLKVNLPRYEKQSLLFASRDRSFEIMAELAREKLRTWVYRANKINIIIFLLHWIELHLSECIVNPNSFSSETTKEHLRDAKMV